MSKEPSPFDAAAWSASVMSRMSDLAHYADARGLQLTFASGTCTHNLPVTIIVATGEMAEDAKVLAKAWTERLEQLAAKAAAERATN